MKTVYTNGKRKGSGAMKDFIFAAFPWVVMGLSIAVLAVVFNEKEKRKADIAQKTDQAFDQKSDEKEKSEDNYGLLGMCLGMSLGLALGTAMDHLALGLSLGMLAGLAVGSCIKKEGET